MEAGFEEELDADSLDLVELIMSIEEDFGIEISEDNGGPLDGGRLSVSPVPRRGPFPTLSGGAGTVPPPDEDDEES